MEEINPNLPDRCFLCSNITEFTTECKCRICQNCLFSQIATQNFSRLNKKTVDFKCPNPQCKKEISCLWIYTNMSQIQINCINEILLRKFISQSSEMKKCGNEYCSYVGWVPRNQKCNDYLYCDWCMSKWTDPSLLYYDYFFRIYIFLSMFITNMINAFREFKVQFRTIKCPFCTEIFIFNAFNSFCPHCHRTLCATCMDDHGSYNSLKSAICCWKGFHFFFFFGLFLVSGFFKLVLSFYYIGIAMYYLVWIVIYQIIFLVYGWAMFWLIYFIFYEFIHPYYPALHPVGKILSFFAIVGILSIHIYSYMNFVIIPSMTHYFLVELIILGIGIGIGYIIYHMLYPNSRYGN